MSLNVNWFGQNYGIKPQWDMMNSLMLLFVLLRLSAESSIAQEGRLVISPIW